MKFTSPTPPRLTPLGQRLINLSTSKLSFIDNLPIGAREPGTDLLKGVLVRQAVKAAWDSVEATNWRTEKAMGLDVIGEEEEEDGEFEEEDEEEEGKKWFDEFVEQFVDDDLGSEEGVSVMAACDVLEYGFDAESEADVQVVEVDGAEVDEDWEDEDIDPEMFFSKIIEEEYLPSTPGLAAQVSTSIPTPLISPLSLPISVPNHDISESLAPIPSPLISPLTLPLARTSPSYNRLSHSLTTTPPSTPIPTALISPFTLSYPLGSPIEVEDLEDDELFLPPPLYRSLSSSSVSSCDECVTPEGSHINLETEDMTGIEEGKETMGDMRIGMGLGLVFDGLRSF